MTDTERLDALLAERRSPVAERLADYVLILDGIAASIQPDLPALARETRSLAELFRERVEWAEAIDWARKAEQDDGSR